MTKKIQLAIGTSTTPIPVLPIPIKEPRDPDERDFGYEPGQLFFNTETRNLWINDGILNQVPQWQLIVGPSDGPILEITVDSGTSPVKPNNNGNINLTSSDGSISVDGTSADTIDLTIANLPLSINIQSFVNSGTYTPTAGMVYTIVEIIGGGGAGGSVSSNAAQGASAAGGGAGGYSRKAFSAATIGASQIVTIGAGGTPGAAGNNPGGNGGTTSFGAFLTATGGNGGSGAAAQASNGASTGGQGGTGSGGTVNAIGAAGNAGVFIFIPATANFFLSGGGASSQLGGGAAALASTSGGDFAGNAGNSSGSGGSGAASISGTPGASGGAGGGGIVIVTEFIGL